MRTLIRRSIRTAAPFATGLAAFLLATAPALAQDANTPAQPPATPEVDTGGDTFTIGVGGATAPTYEGSDRNNLIPIGAVRGTLAGFNFISVGTRFYVDVIRNGPGPVVDVELGPVIGVNLDRTSGIADAQVEALGEKKIALELGGYVGIGKTGVITSDYDKISVSVSYVHDVNNAYKSYVITPDITYGTPLSRKAYVSISANAAYIGEGYADSFFSVDAPGAVRSGLPVYNAGKGWKNWTVSTLGTYSLTGNLLHGLSAVAGLSYSRLINDAADSPVVRIAGDRDQWYGGVGLAYTF